MRHILLILLLVGATFGSANHNHGSETAAINQASDKATGAGEEESKTVWTCSMHPQIKADGPGKCPICFMDLIPLDLTNVLPQNVIELDANQQYSGAILTYPVKDGHDQKNIQLYGRVKLIPEQVYRVTAWVGGRVDRLFVASKGRTVEPGEKLYSIYSPVLITAQEELIQAKRLLKSAKPKSNHYQSLKTNVKAIRQKLKFLGLSDLDLKRIESLPRPESHLIIHAERGGIIRHVAINEGEYVKEGTPILMIADMKTLWVEASVYEDDLQTARGKIKSRIILDSHPREEIEAKLVRIDPFIDPKTRSSRAIFQISNPRGEYHEDGFARVQIEGHSKSGLLVPHSAALFTGQNAVVFVKKGNQFTAKMVRILEKTQSYYRVLGDLKVGDDVVAQGTFKIDSEFQLQAKDSMMSSKELLSPYGTRLDFRSPVEKAADWLKLRPPSSALMSKLQSLLDLYLELQYAMAEDSFDESKEIMEEIHQSLSAIDLEHLETYESRVIELLRGELAPIMQRVAASSLFKDYRECFGAISRWFIVLIESDWINKELDLRKVYCPMAFDEKGGFWVQNEEDILNPYFGMKMQKCGEFKPWGKQ